MSKKIFLLLLLFVIAAIFYFSWLPDPTFKNETYLPKWLLNWSNKYYNLRTAVPFIGLGFLLEAYSQQKSINRRNYNKYCNVLRNVGVATIIVCIAEAGQIFIRKRNLDIIDIFYGIAGSSLGALVYNFFIRAKYEK